MEEEKKEVLVIKSDKEWLQYFRIRVNGVILFILMEIVVEVVFNYDLWKSRATTHEIAVNIPGAKYLSDLEKYRAKVSIG